MRETKVQTIARLERKLAEKEAELKEVKRLSRADKRDSKAHISDLQKAYKREIRIGRQNPQYYEVLEGLNPGEKVITSSYDNYGDNEVLVIN